MVRVMTEDVQLRLDIFLLVDDRLHDFDSCNGASVDGASFVHLSIVSLAYIHINKS